MLRCPACGEQALSTIECRHTRSSTRRRRECISCGHRATTHEVSQEWFQLAEENSRALALIRSALGKTPGSDAVPCESCTLNTGSRCSADLPEYGGRDAEGCAAYGAANS